METGAPHIRIAKVSAVSFLSALVIFFVARFFAERLPPSSIEPSVLQAPEQSQLPSDSTPFHVEFKGKNYAITPKFKYKLTGLIVSRMHSDSWTNITHAKIGDHLNTGDLCVVWGENASHPFFNKLKFWSGDWTCYVQATDREAWSRFKINQLSNNHVLPATPAIAQLIQEARIGDQIRLEGELIDYSLNGSPPRISSITRDDIGEHACEVVFVRDFQILRKAHTGWRNLQSLALIASAVALITLLIAMFAMPFLKGVNRSE